MAAKAIPSHLKAEPPVAETGAFERKHHGKSQSHMVRSLSFFYF